MSSQNRTQRIAFLGMLIALAMILSWLESQIPPLVAIPGMKLGLTNLVVLVSLYRVGEKEALVINILRIILVGVSFGNAFSIVYSLSGGLLSGGIMLFLKRTNRFKMVTVSIAGGVFHNVGQIMVAMFLLETSALIYYLPFLWMSGIVAGVIVGEIAYQVTKRLPVME